jgi:hypothetical protein
MNIIRAHIRVVFVLCALWLLGLLASCSNEVSVSSQERQIAEMVSNWFIKDWGMPDHLEIIPPKCFLIERFYSLSDSEVKLIQKQFPEAGKAIGDLVRKSTKIIMPQFDLPCERTSRQFNADEDPWNIHSGTGQPRRFGILEISRIGIDEDGNIAIAVVQETRGDLAGSVWAIMLHRISGKWTISKRIIIAKM